MCLIYFKEQKKVHKPFWALWRNLSAPITIIEIMADTFQDVHFSNYQTILKSSI